MAQVKFSFNAKRNEDGRWSYTYDYDAKKISFDKMICTDSEIIFEAVLDTNDSVSEVNDPYLNPYLNELSILFKNGYNEIGVKDIFKRINLTSIDFSKADDRGNINLYTFNKHTTPVYIRFGDPDTPNTYSGDPDTPNTYSYEEVKELKEKYLDDTGDYMLPSRLNGDIYKYQCIIAVDLIKSNVFKEHDVYLLYVVTRTMYEMVSGHELTRLGMDEGQRYISNFLTKERLSNCLVK